MTLFKNIDDKFAEIGFEKIEETKYGAVYRKEIKECNYIQEINILHKENGYHIVQSCDPNLFDSKNIGNTCVGLTAYEMKLCLKKMKSMGWKINK